MTGEEVTGMMKEKSVRYFWVMLLVVVWGCSEPTISEEAAGPYVEQWSATVEATLRGEAERAAGSEALQARIEAAVAAEEGRPEAAIAFARLVQEVYAEREFAPGLVSDEGLTAAGVVIYEALQDLEAHQLDPGPYRLDTIEEARAQFEEQKGTIAGYEGFEAQAVDREEALAWLMEQPESAFALTEENYEVLTQTLLEDGARGARMREAIEAYQAKRQGLTATSARLEERLAQALVRYAREQRHFRIKEIFLHPRTWDLWNEPDLQKPGRRPDPERGAFLARQIWRDAAHLSEEVAKENEYEIYEAKIKETLRAVLESDDPAHVVKRIAPRQPQYAGLVAEYKRYRAIVEAGGWEEVRRSNGLREGSRGEVVEELKRRLQAEGYFPQDVEIDAQYDEALTAAIRAYQETHQMAVTGRPHHLFWGSLNISAQRRLAQIGLNIRRWRESNVDHDLEVYTFVNVPDFSVAVYQNGERRVEHRTVVGNNGEHRNPFTGEMEHSSRTPTPVAAYIDRVIYNPYWNVTETIRAAEILPEVRKSLETKYVKRLLDIYEEANASADQPRVGGARGLVASAEPAGAEGIEGEGAGENEEVVDDGLTQEEREEVQREARRQEALAKFTEMRRVPLEGTERMENRRFFLVEKLEELRREVYGEGEEAVARFRGKFPYLNWESGEVDVSLTNMENVPSWYEENDYEVVQVGDWEYVRELPGPTNSLGKVKIIFPNYHNIYLHDTPAKNLFNQDIRGFSHGCIRVQDPLDLAEVILEVGGIEGTNIGRILRDEEYYPIFLRKQIPVFVEYYTVRIDEEGRANFLADIYGYDVDALADGS